MSTTLFLPVHSLNEDAVAYALASAITSVVLVRAVRIQFKRQQHYIFLAFVCLVFFYFADHTVAELQSTQAGFLSVVWWAEVVAPVPLLLALLYHAVLRRSGPLGGRWERFALVGAYACAVVYVALAALDLSLLVSPIETTTAGWTHGPGSLGPYLSAGGLAWPSIAIGALILANLGSQYNFRRSPVIRGQVVYIAVGLGVYLLALQSVGALRTVTVHPIQPLLESAGVAVMIVGGTTHGFYPANPVSEAVSRILRQPRDLVFAEGRSYLGMDQGSCFSSFSDLVRDGREGLCVTTIPPDEIRERYALDRTPIKWLANSARDEAIDPSDLAGLSASLASFIMRAERPIILLDGLDYLVSSNGFKPTMALVNKISQTNAVKGGILLISSSVDKSLASREQQSAILEVFEDISVIQARLKGGGTVEVGENFLIQLDFFNIGKRPAYIERVDEFVIPGRFKVTLAPKGCKIRGSSLLMGGKRLDPFQLESVVIGLLAGEEQGKGAEGAEEPSARLGGRVVFRNEMGVESSHSIEPISVRVLRPQALELESAQAKSVFSFLVEAFNQDYMVSKRPLDQSGWRTIGQVAEGAGISTSSLYGTEGKYGRPIYELLRRGLIERRTFAQHRGRGGEAVKVRVSYDRDPVRRYVDRMLLRRK